MSDTRAKKSTLNYTLENCAFAYNELCKVNAELIKGMSPSSKADVNHLGAMNRMIQDYLIVRVGSLFDRTRGVVSMAKIFAGQAKFEVIKNQEVIKYIIEQRNNFVAHNNPSHIKANFPVTAKICNSNLGHLLKDLLNLLKKQ